MPEQQTVSLTPQQVRDAAGSGVQLLELPTLQVPGALAMGQLGILKSLLQAMASGTLILAAPPVVKPLENEGAVT